MADKARTINVTSFRLMPTWLRRSIISTFIFLVIATTLLTAVLPRDLPPTLHHNTSPEQVEKLEELDQVLHPESHRYRKKTTLYYDWTITRSSRRPDGVLTDVYLVNGLFPGPSLEARSGDTLVINVANQLAGDQGISIHWHGLHMRNQNRYDGAIGFTQNPISPGSNFTYVITIADDQWGTFWYHAHDQVQRADGLFGAFIIHKPAEKDDRPREVNEMNRQTEERVLLVGDWYHRPAEDVLKWYLKAGSFGNEPVPDSLLVNGRGAYNCSMAVPARPVDCESRPVPRLSLDSGKQYRFRIINHGSLAGFSIGTNSAHMSVFAVDGGNEVSSGGEAPTVGILYPGQRVDVLITPSPSTADDDESPHLIISLDRENFKYPNPALDSQGVQRFPILIAPTTPSIPSRTSTIDVTRRTDLNTLTASISNQMPEKAVMTLVLYTATQKLSHLHNVPHGFMNETTWSPQGHPQLPLINLPREQWDANQFVPRIDGSNFSGMKGPWVDLVVNNLDDGGHPFHLHGHDVYVLSSSHADRGWGSYNPYSDESPPGPPLNLLDPMKRDTFFVPRRGYTAVRFLADNKGIWMFHCHLLWHHASGMAMGFEVI